MICFCANLFTYFLLYYSYTIFFINLLLILCSPLVFLSSNWLLDCFAIIYFLSFYQSRFTLKKKTRAGAPANRFKIIKFVRVSAHVPLHTRSAFSPRRRLYRYNCKYQLIWSESLILSVAYNWLACLPLLHLLSCM